MREVEREEGVVRGVVRGVEEGMGVVVVEVVV